MVCSSEKRNAECGHRSENPGRPLSSNECHDPGLRLPETSPANTAWLQLPLERVRKEKAEAGVPESQPRQIPIAQTLWKLSAPVSSRACAPLFLCRPCAPEHKWCSRR